VGRWEASTQKNQKRLGRFERARAPGELEDLVGRRVWVGGGLNHLPDAVTLVRVAGHRAHLQLVDRNDRLEARRLRTVSAL